MQDLVAKVRAQAQIDASRLCPVVVLAIREYEHKEWKKTIYNPVLQIQKWISFEEFDDFERVAAPQPAPATPTQTEELSAPVPEPEVAARGNGRRTTAAPQPAPQQPAAEASRPIPMPAGRRPGRRAQPSF